MDTQKPYVCFPLPDRSMSPSLVADDLPWTSVRDFIDVPDKSLASLSTHTAEALAELISCLLCGEESAVHAFRIESKRVSDGALLASQRALCRIAMDEAGHGWMLNRLRDKLPRSHKLEVARAMRRFLVRLGGCAPAVHFARISALDACTCTIMTAVLRHAPEVARNPCLAHVFIRIRGDEARHVRISRRHAIVLGLSQRQLQEETSNVRASLVDLLEPAGDVFEGIGVAPERLFKRLLRANSNGGQNG